MARTPPYPGEERKATRGQGREKRLKAPSSLPAKSDRATLAARASLGTERTRQDAGWGWLVAVLVQDVVDMALPSTEAANGPRRPRNAASDPHTPWSTALGCSSPSGERRTHALAADRTPLGARLSPAGNLLELGPADLSAVVL